MSTIVKRKFTCAHCNKEFENYMYKVIDISENRTYRKHFIDSDYFKYTCPHCGKIFVAFYPILYIDKYNKFMVQYTPKDTFESLMEYVKKIKSDDYTLRICESVYDAVEKVLILENRLDDRVIECCKVILHKSYINKYKDKKVQHIYFNVANNKFYYDILVWGNGNSKYPVRVDFDFDLYNKIYKDKRSEFKSNDYAIDYGYGLQMMNKMS